VYLAAAVVARVLAYIPCCSWLGQQGALAGKQWLLLNVQQQAASAASLGVDLVLLLWCVSAAYPVASVVALLKYKPLTVQVRAVG
jgi:hypothetical protein